MSFSCSFHAPTKAAARHKLAQHTSLPASVKAFLDVAIENLPVGREGEVRIIRVEATGHLCDGPSSYGQSNGSLKVETITASYFD